MCHATLHSQIGASTHVVFMCIYPYYLGSAMGWLQLVGSLKSQVSFAKEPYKGDYILQKRPIILRRLLIVATPLAPTPPFPPGKTGVTADRDKIEFRLFSSSSCFPSPHNYYSYTHHIIHRIRIYKALTTKWHTPTRFPILQVSFHKSATTYRSFFLADRDCNA